MILKNQSGVAILMVITSVAILAFLLADFSFETKVNQLKIYNQQDKLQARLNAEAGLNLALAKLRMYQEARNLLEKNENLKSTIQPSQIESLLLQPFIYPIPAPAGADAMQRSALAEFEETTLFDGEVMVNIAQVAGFLNPNNLRIKPKTEEEREQVRDEDDESTKTPQAYMEDKLVETLKLILEDKSENDREFDNKYGHLNPELLIKELKFYVSDADDFEDVERGEIEGRYLAKNIVPKHSPLSTIDELYLLDGWPDEIVDLFKAHLTVHEVSIIAVNNITVDQLKILFPDITPVQIEEFLKYKNGDPELNIEGRDFKSADDFKQVITSRLGILGTQDYDERMKEFERAGITVGVAGKLYQVTSNGRKGRASYNLIAFVDMPIKPQVQISAPPPSSPNPERPDDEMPERDEEEERPPTNPGQQQEQTAPQELLLPRVVEIRLE